ncbi:MAG: SRPBCC domain-containing protein, partial [Rhizomicrobium sp.]
MAPRNGNSAVLDDRTLTITRLFDAPRDLVFKAWTDPAMSGQWMGPRHYPAFHVEGDVRTGGTWRIGLREADGSKERWQGGVYREVSPPQRLVFTSAWDQDDGSRGPE